MLKNRRDMNMVVVAHTNGTTHKETTFGCTSFSVTDEGHLEFYIDDDVVALFAEGTWANFRVINDE